MFNAALFYQDDWTVSKLLTLSGGLRWEGQNHVADHSDWAPRVAFAYALDGHKKGTTPKTVLRGGFGLFYDRFSTGDLMNLEEQFSTSSAQSQKQFVISDPTCFDGTSLSTHWLNRARTATQARRAPLRFTRFRPGTARPIWRSSA